MGSFKLIDVNIYIEIYTTESYLNLTYVKYSVRNCHERQRKGVQFQQSNAVGKYVIKFGISGYL